MAEDIKHLRARAEEFLRNNPQAGELDDEQLKVSQLIHELSVYQVELEMQNNQLKSIQEELLNSNVSFYTLYNEAPVGYVIIDKDNNILKVNETFLRYINATTQSVLRRPLIECFEGDSRLQLMAWMRSDKIRLEEIELEATARGETRYLKVSSADVDSWLGKPCKFLVFTDSTELVEAKRVSALSAAAVEAASEGCFVVDNNQRIVFVNPALLKMFGYQEEEVIGRHPDIFCSEAAGDDFTKRIWREVSKGNEWQEEVILANKNKQDFVCMVRMSPMAQSTDSNYAYVAMLADVTERKRFQDTILKQATLDALTGLPNRSLLTDRLEHALQHAQRYGTQCAVMFLDLDGFKDINDTYGHDVGDDLLIEVAARLKHNIRESDTLARMSGDEFIFVFTEIDIDEIEHLGKKILNSFENKFHLKERQHQITASLGCALYPQHATSAGELLRLADQAMYVAKRRGKDQFALVQSEQKKPA
jgi:diguanylate cyclase (GGDEF)-like protein/PAS domain S-box-containing protein